MAESQSHGKNNPKVRPQQHSRQRVASESRAIAAPTYGEEGPLNLGGGLLGSDFSQSTFERHAALLGDSRTSQPMYARQKAMIVQQLQRDYGNRYVQRLVKHISQQRVEAVQAKLTVGSAGDKYEQEADRVA